MSLTERLEAITGRFATFQYRKPFPALILAVLLTAVSGYYAGKLRLNADLTELLPKSFQSVRDIDRLRVRFGGMGYIVVAGLNADPDTLRRFADDMAPKLEKLPETRFVDFKRADQFFEDRSLYYLDEPDLKTMRTRIAGRINYEKRTQNPLYIDLDGEQAPSLDFSDIEQKYKGTGNRRLAGHGESYYLDAQEKMIVILVKPNGNSANLGYSQKAVSQVEKFLESQDLTKYGPGFKAAITGTYKKKVDQQREITSDLARSSTVTLILLIAYLIFHFRSALAVAFTLIPVLVSLTWTYGLVGAIYGQVNLLTGFLGAILGGLSVEHGIHLLGRFGAERSQKKGPEESVRNAFAHTGFSAIVSSLVAALTFLSLAISEFRAFREFGVIAAIGMLVSVTVYLLLLPALVGVGEKIRLHLGTQEAVHAERSQIARWLPLHYRGFLTAIGLGIAVLVAFAPQVHFNYDFSALDDVTLPSVQLDKKIDRILGHSQTPVVVLTDTPQAEREAAQKLRERKRKAGDSSTIDFVLGLEDLVPQNQQQKQALIKDIGTELTKVRPGSLKGDALQQYERAERLSKAQPFTRADLPDTIRRQFQGADGAEGGFVLVFANISLADAQGVRRLAQEVRNLRLSSGEQVSAAGEAMVLVDILEMVIRESPRILVAAILSVLFAMWLTLGNLKTALICLSPTLLSIVSLVGLMGMTGMPFNYLNILVIPVLVGTTVDAGVHLISRLHESGSTHFAPVYAETGRAICGGLLTSVVGFGALTLARHPGLNSIGDLAVLGFAVNLLVMLLGFPALLLVISTRRERSAALASAAAIADDAKAAGEANGAAGTQQPFVPVPPASVSKERLEGEG